MESTSSALPGARHHPAFMPEPYDRCVRKVKAKGGVTNAYAVCRASMGTDKQIRARHRKKKRGSRR